MRAAYYGLNDIIEVLVGAGADVNAQNEVREEMSEVCNFRPLRHPTGWKNGADAGHSRGIPENDVSAPLPWR